MENEDVTALHWSFFAAGFIFGVMIILWWMTPRLDALEERLYIYEVDINEQAHYDQ